MSHFRPIVSIAAVGILLSVAAHAETRSFTGKKLRIHNLIGKATVVAGSGPGFQVEITRGGGDAADLEIATEKDGDTEVLRLRYRGDRFVYPAMRIGSNSSISISPDGSFGGSNMVNRRQVKVAGTGSGRQLWADLRIVVPKDASLKLYNAIGRISAESVSADLDFDTASGDVEARGITGDVGVDVGSGDVELARITGNVGVDTGSGSVILADITGDVVDADTGSGHIEGERLACDQLSMDTGSGDISLKRVQVRTISCDTGSGSILVSLGSDLDGGNLDTGSGDVTLEVGTILGASLDIETGSGSIDIDAPHEATRVRRNEFRGTVGDGKGTVVIETGSGDVLVRRAP
ncbi:MAG: DUF4097 family beta strand repeat-containing protein [Candidatus Eisenbacteria bacterium]|nr:DUF4097 family beta strand repeat-containing protein [Candidatus Eisenbacteria bacterium]